jgi:putative SOS response-associated peptidase YedK
MCGRIVITLPNNEMAHLFEAESANDLPEGARHNVCPTQQVATIISSDGRRKLTSMRWGFLPNWYETLTSGPLIINARAGSLAEKPAFAKAARTQRCLIPVSGFYEWAKSPTGQRLPWYFQPVDAAPMVFAGIWQLWERADVRHVTCAIVTCAANPVVAQIHHRMPVILSAQDWPLWLGEAGHGAAKLMRAAPVDALQFHRVDPAVNSNRASGEALIVPFKAG